MSTISRRMLLCALPAPFLPRLFDEQTRAIQLTISGSVDFSQQAIDQIIAGIREAVDDRDVIIFDQKRAV